MRISREWLLLGGSLLVIAAVYNHYIGGHSAYLLEIIFVAAGGVLALLSFRFQPATRANLQDGLVIRLLTRVITKDQAIVILPVSGFALIIGWSLWKMFAAGETNLRMEDIIVTLFGLSLILYYHAPSQFALQRDFVVLYLFFLTIVFAVIWKAYELVSGESYGRITAYSEYYLITSPVVFLVRLLGVHANAELNLSGHGMSNMIDYEYHDRMLRVGIGAGCSGLYSAGLFFSAFLAFVLVRYSRVDYRILAALGIGFVMTWLSNILRMVITVLVGSAYGHPALAFVHSYLGVLLFALFITIFWILIVRWLDKREEKYNTIPPREVTAPVD